MASQHHSGALRIIFAGTPEFAAIHLQQLLTTPHHIIAVLTQPDRPAGRGKNIVASPVKQLAQTVSIPVLQPISLKTEQIQKQIRDLNADILIVVAYGLLLPQAVLSLPRLGCLNVHGSLLPRWRGAAPIQRACLCGDTETGITLMQMDEGLDTGDILLQIACPIEKEDTSASLYQKLAKLGAGALPNLLTQLLAGDVYPQKQDEKHASYASKLTRQEAQLDWHKSAAELDRAIRAFNPWPGSYFALNGQRIKVWQSQVAVKCTTASPGTILHTDKNGIHIATSNGVLVLTKLQPAGKKIVSAWDLLNAHRDWFALNRVLPSGNKG